MQVFSKEGQGAYYVSRSEHSAAVFVNTRAATRAGARRFDSAREAYDFYRPMASGDHAVWNACYALEELLKDAA